VSMHDGFTPDRVREQKVRNIFSKIFSDVLVNYVWNLQCKLQMRLREIPFCTCLGVFPGVVNGIAKEFHKFLGEEFSLVAGYEFIDDVKFFMPFSKRVPNVSDSIKRKHIGCGRNEKTINSRNYYLV